MSPQSSGALADTLLQQRAKLKPVQTSASTKALLASTAAGTSGGDKVAQASDKGQTSGRTGGAGVPKAAARVSGDKSGVGVVQQVCKCCDCCFCHMSSSAC